MVVQRKGLVFEFEEPVDFVFCALEAVVYVFLDDCFDALLQRPLPKLSKMGLNKLLTMLHNRRMNSLAQNNSRLAPFLDNTVDKGRLHDKGVVAR